MSTMTAETSENLLSTPLRAIELMTGKRVVPYGEWMFFRKTFTPAITDDDGNVVLHLSDNAAEGPESEPAWNELLGFGPDCRHVSWVDIGLRALLPVWCNGMYRLGALVEEDGDGNLIANEDWCIRESVFMDHFAFFVQE